MNVKKLLPVLCLSVLICGINCSQSLKTRMQEKQAEGKLSIPSEGFALYIEQRGRSVPVGNGQTVTISREPFAFQFRTQPAAGFAVSISRDDTFLTDLLDGIKEIPVFARGTGIAEGGRNENRMAFISETGSNYWVFKDSSNTRFDEYRLVDNGQVLTRTIESMRDHRMGNDIPMSAVDEDTFYVCVLKRKRGALINEWPETQRLGFRLALGERLSVTGDSVEITMIEKLEPESEVASVEKTVTDSRAETDKPTKKREMN
ncbi:hypothetical protein CHISP_0935 [Chitinispirillum alkaliphilum]|nr:hypothetical protein CHISP_0935 [Chitinispirillum alkaliphilum]